MSVPADFSHSSLKHIKYNKFESESQILKFKEGVKNRGEFTTINPDGNVNPFKTWILDYYYDKLNN